MIDLNKLPDKTEVYCLMDTGIMLKIKRGTDDKYFLSYSDGAMSIVTTEGVVRFNPYKKTERHIMEIYTRQTNPEYYL